MIAALLHNPTNPEGTFNDLAAVAAARANGWELWGQVSCCPLYMDFSLKSAYPMEGLNAWKPATVGRDDDQLDRFVQADKGSHQADADHALDRVREQENDGGQGEDLGIGHDGEFERLLRAGRVP